MHMRCKLVGCNSGGHGGSLGVFCGKLMRSYANEMLTR